MEEIKFTLSEKNNAAARMYGCMNSIEMNIKASGSKDMPHYTEKKVAALKRAIAGLTTGKYSEIMKTLSDYPTELIESGKETLEILEGSKAHPKGEGESLQERGCRE